MRREGFPRTRRHPRFAILYIQPATSHTSSAIARSRRVCTKATPAHPRTVSTHTLAPRPSHSRSPPAVQAPIVADSPLTAHPSTPRTMLSNDGANSRLVLAVEASSVHQVRAALREGADPNKARKTVTLKVRVGGFFGTSYEKRAEAEPVLALAIRTGNVDILKELLDAGCDPNAEISWVIPHARRKWTHTDWDRYRWVWTYEFPNALDLALTGSVVAFNRKGAHLTYKNPRTEGETYESFKLAPSIDVVQLLLSRGVQVRSSALAKAKQLSRGRTQFGESYETKTGAGAGAGAGAAPTLEFYTRVEAARQLQLEVRKSILDLKPSPASATASVTSSLSGDTLTPTPRNSVSLTSDAPRTGTSLTIPRDTSGTTGRLSAIWTHNTDGAPEYGPDDPGMPRWDVTVTHIMA
ncbi:hypothetical protein M427DRAFT_27458 [Gonapodya prolifera JEL478]|uniref:Uncharacterized protein n=1 Tax=Gonapodya prolifera (strain JEL478) TaxID=1344416 RepID=A0A139AYY6_GONPJ|nr:hypothetical protein M427DRAFT_27458 [Gonapodya prolifera JEL478]|eukprot:KXS21927.1 hypothetical protein M427DRAFT_27458 [Gonapodya prolifera JEL478]